MKYKIKVPPQFEKDFAKLDSVTQSKVLVVLESMKEKPLFNSKKLKSVKVGCFRRRIGDFRLRFDCEKKIVCLYRVRHRKEVYR
ncbi:MAG: type II toxin-antitoxin system RelE/ParE family toxin [Patescibacteria group bacterium]|nr:type II toxin-antitoxin system RelE/ParE family toxin [Patescibacteria group bacterium]